MYLFIFKCLSEQTCENKIEEKCVYNFTTDDEIYAAQTLTAMHVSKSARSHMHPHMSRQHRTHTHTHSHRYCNDAVFVIKHLS